MLGVQAGVTSVCNRHHAISLLCADDPALLRFLFTTDRHELRWGDLTPDLAGKVLAAEEALLIRVAVDLWQGDGGVRLADICGARLAAPRFSGLIMALELLHGSGGCDCLNCLRRLGTTGQQGEAFPQ